MKECEGTDAELIDLISAGERSRNSFDAIQAEQMLTYVDRARVAGEQFAGLQAGRLEASAATHELSMALMLPVATIEGHVAVARRVRSQLPAVWAAWHAGDVTTRKVGLIDQAAGRLTQQTSRGVLDTAVVDVAARKTPGQLRSWLDRFVERLEAASARDRHDKARQRPPGLGSTGRRRHGLAHRAGVGVGRRGNRHPPRLRSSDRSPVSDPRTHEQARADMFCDLLLGSIGQSDGMTTTIGVIVPIQSLMGLSDAPGEMADRSASVPASLIRSKAVQPGTLFWRLLTDNTVISSTPPGSAATPPDQLGQAVRLRDGTSFSRPPSFRPTDQTSTTTWPIQPDHSLELRELAPQGPTTSRPRITQPPKPEPGVFEWTTRTGHRYTHTAEPSPPPMGDQRVPTELIATIEAEINTA